MKQTVRFGQTGANIGNSNKGDVVVRERNLTPFDVDTEDNTKKDRIEVCKIDG